MTENKQTTNENEENSDYDTVTSRTPLRTPTKSARFSIPPTAGSTSETNNGDPEKGNKDEADVSTPLTNNRHGSSPSSLAERIKDKISNAVPNVMHTQKNERPNEYKLRAFVGFLFLAIIFLVAFAYIFYYQQLSRRSYFERIRFSEEDRLMRVFDDAGLEALRGHMGATFPLTGKAFNCHDKHKPPNATVCREWMGRGRFSLARVDNQHHDDKSRCYRVIWQSLSPDTHPTDCYEMNNHFWFGAGAVLGHEYDFAGWPLNRAEVPMSPFVTGSEVRGNNGWGPVLRRYFMSSKAAAIIVDDSTPLWVSVNSNQSQQLCLQSRTGQWPFFDHGEDFTWVDKTDPLHPVYSVLNYTICTATDLETLLTSLADTTMWDGIRKDEMEILRKLMEDPVWRFQPRADDNETVQSLMKFTNNIVGSVWTSPGYLLIDSPWEEHPGDLEFDAKRFQGLNQALEIIHRKGFKVAVTVRPYVSTFSSSYKSGLEFTGTGSVSVSMPAGSWIALPYGEGAPALTSFAGENSLALADVTCPSVSRWVGQRLRALVSRHDLDGIFFESVTVDHLPHYYVTNKHLQDPSKLSSLWVDAARQVTNVISVTSAVQMPRLPTFVTIPWLPSSWEGLAHLLPLVLTLSVSGYPFIIPPPVGGFTSSVNSSMSAVHPYNSSIPERELYIRWLQISAFLPVMQFSTLPIQYDAEVDAMASNLTLLRQSTILPLLQRYGGDSVINGLPIMRPLWMLDPFDKEGLDVSNEFCVGDELLIAPILEEGMREREVYLPKGVWKDGIDGSLRKGGRWIHHHRVRLDQIAYFLRMPEGTRL